MTFWNIFPSFEIAWFWKDKTPFSCWEVGKDQTRKYRKGHPNFKFQGDNNLVQSFADMTKNKISSEILPPLTTTTGTIFLQLSCLGNQKYSAWPPGWYCWTDLDFQQKNLQQPRCFPSLQSKNLQQLLFKSWVN